MTNLLNNKTKYFFAIAIVTVLLCIIQLSASTAEAENTTINDLTTVPAYNNLTDGTSATYSTLDTITLKSETAIDSIYLVFWDKAINYTLSCGDKSFAYESTYLHTFLEIPAEVTDCHEVTLTFAEATDISDIFAFSEGTLPDWVQVWEAPYVKADLLLNSTHADDEQLFFAGVLPYYSAKGYRVQVVYFTDHADKPNRRHELLNGLWTAGIDHYPVISNFPDAYSVSSQGALTNLKNAGYTEDDVVAFQTEVIRRFKPQVIVGHDLKGEYGHGQHILNAETTIKGVELASNAENYPESAQKYGTWDTPKLYIHLYEVNQITMNWDEPLEELGGKSAFQKTQEGFMFHNSQHWTWFYTWLMGTNNNITTASQIQTYSPCLYGLYRSTVGEDVAKNDFFENLTSYDEQERLEQERLEQERLEQERLEQQKAEESRRLESEAESLEEASRAEASRQEAESQKLQAEKDKEQAQIKAVISITVLVAAVVALTVILIKKLKRN